jgi:twinkle protein
MRWLELGIDITKVRHGKTFCPRCHHERQKHRHERELSVDLEKGLFNCHHCGWSGTAKEFEKMEAPKRVYRKPVLRSQPVKDKTIEWFKSRGISESTLTKAKVTSSEEFMPQVGQKRNCICFNYFRNGELVNVKYRDGAKNFKLEKDAELIFYNLDSIVSADKERDLAVIVEGEMDCLSLIECGVKVALSVPNGASKGSQRLEYLDNCWEWFEGFKEIIIATDNDEAGKGLEKELSRRLGRERCFSVVYPDGCKDFNEVLLKTGKGKVLDVLKNAIPYPLEGIESPDDVYRDTLSIFQNGFPNGQKIGYSELDEHISWKGSELTTITGTPGAGKSTLLNNILIRLADRHDWRFGMFTPEKQPTSILAAELIEIMTGKRFRGSGDVGQLNIDEFNSAMAFVSDRFFVMKIDEMEVTIDGILDKARELVLYYGIKGLVIDPWNYIEHKIPAGQSETQYISEALTKIKRFKDRYDAHVFLVAHPTKIQKTNGVYEVPDLYKISGSAHFFNKTDNGLVVYRNYSEGCTDVHIQKIRWFFIGKIGMVKMKYNIENKRFTEVQNETF